MCTMKVQMSFVGPDGHERNYVIEKRMHDTDLGQRIAFSEQVMESLNDMFWGPEGDTKLHQTPSERAAEALCRSFAPTMTMAPRVERKVEEIIARGPSAPLSCTNGESLTSAALASACLTVDSSALPTCVASETTPTTPEDDPALRVSAPDPSPSSSDLDLQGWRKPYSSSQLLDVDADSYASNGRIIQRSVMSNGGDKTPTDQISIDKAIATARWSSPGMALGASKWPRSGSNGSFPMNMGESFDTEKTSMTRASSCTSKTSKVSSSSEIEELFRPPMWRRAFSMVALPRTGSFIDLSLKRRQKDLKNPYVQRLLTGPSSPNNSVAAMLPESPYLSMDTEGTDEHAEDRGGARAKAVAADHDTDFMAAEPNSLAPRPTSDSDNENPTKKMELSVRRSGLQLNEAEGGPTSMMHRSTSRRSDLDLDQIAGNQTPGRSGMHRSTSRRSDLDLDQIAGNQAPGMSEGPLDRMNGSPVVMKGSRSPLAFGNRCPLRGSRSPLRRIDSPSLSAPLIRKPSTSTTGSNDSDEWHAKWTKVSALNICTNSFSAEPCRTAIQEVSDEDSDLESNQGSYKSRAGRCSPSSEDVGVSDVISRILSNDSIESASNTFSNHRSCQEDKVSPASSSGNPISPASSTCDTFTHKYGSSMRTSRAGSRAGSETSSSSRLRAMLAKAQFENDRSRKSSVVISDGGCPYSQADMIPEALSVKVMPPPPPLRISRAHGAVLR